MGLGGYVHGREGTFPPSLLNQTKPRTWKVWEEIEVMTQAIRHRLDPGEVG